MEKNCLVTTYKATVNDNSLLKVGEMFIDIIEQASPTNQTNRLYLNTGNTTDLVIEVENGAANLTLDEGMASGWTNKITLPKSVSASAPIFVRNGNYRVKVASKYNLKESIQNICCEKFYVYCLNSVYNHILEWMEELDHVRMATILRINRVVNFDDKDRLYAYEYKTEYSIRNIERILANYTKQAKEFMIKMKKQEIENDFKST